MIISFSNEWDYLKFSSRKNKECLLNHIHVQVTNSVLFNFDPQNKVLNEVILGSSWFLSVSVFFWKLVRPKANVNHAFCMFKSITWPSRWNVS